MSTNEDWRYSVARVMLTGIIKNEFYRNKEDISREALKFFINAAKQDPEYLLKAAAFARTCNKDMVLLALASLAGSADNYFLDNNRDVIISILSTFNPKQLLQFVNLIKINKIGFDSRSQKWIAKVMESWPPNKLETYTLQYTSTIKALVHLVHPSYNDVRSNLIRYVLDKKNPFGNKQKVVELLKNTNPSSEIIAKTMIKYDIPWNVIKGFYAGYNTGDVGLATLTQMDLTALLLNLKSLERGGIFNDDNGIKTLKLKLNEVKNNNVIPLDFAKTYIQVSNNNIKDILVDTIVDIMGNKTSVIEERKIGLSIDVSSSMAGCGQDCAPLRIAGLIAVTFLQSKNLWFTTFNNKLHEEDDTICPSISNKSKKDQVKALLNLHVDGSTYLSAPIIGATKQNRKLDLMIIITDDQQNMDIAQAWKEYCRKINPKAELWIINSSNINLHPKDIEKDNSITTYQTITPAIFDNLKFIGQDLVSTIEQFDLKQICKIKPVHISYILE